MSIDQHQPDLDAATPPPDAHPEVTSFLAQVAALGLPRVTTLPLETMRQTTAVNHLDPAPEPVAAVDDLAIPVHQGQVTGRLYQPDAPAGQEIVLFFHGGGWVLGGLETHDALCRFICNVLRRRVLSLAYRLAPEHPFPTAYEDALAAARWLATSPGSCGTSISGLVLAGDSAGGNLAAAVASTLVGDRTVPLVAQLLLYPVLDAAARTPSYAAFANGFLLEAEDMHFFVEQYVPEVALRDDPRVSPLRSPATSAPPTVLVTAGLDVLRDEGRAYAGKLAAAGIETHFHEAVGLIHAFATMRGALPTGETVLRRALSDLAGILAARG